MTDDTKRALEIIQPIAEKLNIKVSADDKILYLDGMGIGISMNSTYATLMEFIGWLFMVKYDPDFRKVKLTEEQQETIGLYWITPEILKKLEIKESEGDEK